jgi:hypothetical protein
MPTCCRRPRQQPARQISVSFWKTRSADATFAADVILDCAARIR